MSDTDKPPTKRAATAMALKSSIRTDMMTTPTKPEATTKITLEGHVGCRIDILDGLPVDHGTGLTDDSGHITDGTGGTSPTPAARREPRADTPAGTQGRAPKCP
jgi:hypothetical protein